MRQHFSMPGILALFDEGTAAPVESGAQDTSTAAPGGTDAGKWAERLTNPGSSRRDRRAGAALRRGQLAAAKQTVATTPAAEGGTQEKQAADTPDAAKQPNASEQADVERPEARRARFRALVDGEFKDLYTEAVQGIIDRRFRQTKLLEERLAAQRPVVEALLAQYGIHDGDMAKLANALDRGTAAQGDSSPQGEAEPGERLTRLEEENRALRAREQQHRKTAAMEGQYDDWMQQAEQTRAAHTEFDLHAEVKNPLFLSMLKARVPMQHAYEVLHLDDIKGSVAQQSAQQTEQEVLERIRAKGARPVENGLSSQNGIPIHTGLSQLSRRDRADIARRAARGERITL